jgi:hypothetical protein
MSNTYKDSRKAKADRDTAKMAHFKPIKFKHDEQDWDSQLHELLHTCGYDSLETDDGEENV